MAASKKLFKKIFLAGMAALLFAAAVVWYVFTQKFDDTSTTKPAYEASAMPFISEYKKDIKAANFKYSEKIITINGTVSEIETADTTLNIKMADANTGDYVIFAFQQQDMEAVKKIKQGDSISVKGSCSGGAYSDILETTYVAFKRCSLNKSINTHQKNKQ
jgi:hypothetical protein